MMVKTDDVGEKPSPNDVKRRLDSYMRHSRRRVLVICVRRVIVGPVHVAQL